MCGTTSQENGGRNHAWSVKLDNRGNDQIALTFDLLELNGNNGSVSKVSGRSKFFLINRRSCRQEIGFGF
jgi:hypothetical protein